MKKPGRYPFYLLSVTHLIVTVVVGILFSSGMLWQPQKAEAATVRTPTFDNAKNDASILSIKPVWQEAVSAATPIKLPTCLKSTALPLCYSPQQIRRAYGVQSLLNAGITGKGRTIVLIEAFQDPTLQTDLQLFDHTFGLPDPKLKIIAPFGSTPFDAKDPAQTSFAAETALDTQWAHAMAPDATIVVMQANVVDKSGVGQLTALMKATQFAVQHQIGDVISMSFSIGEHCLGAKFIQQAHTIFQQAKANKQTLLASSGDTGAATQQCDARGNIVGYVQGAGYPASDSLVTSVGGTRLLASKTGVYQSETTWNDALNGNGATGGGFSAFFARPAYQQNLPIKSRGEGDIAFDADPNTGVPVVTGSAQPGTTLFLPIGGTSLGAPAIAGIVALFDQAAGYRLGFLNDAIYGISRNPALYAQAFHDIQTEDNSFVFVNLNKKVVRIQGFAAAPNWDAPTGVGSPKVSMLAKYLSKFS